MINKMLLTTLKWKHHKLSGTIYTFSTMTPCMLLDGKKKPKNLKKLHSEEMDVEPAVLLL